MKVLSLFSGVGGFDLGLEAAGMETVFQCEWDKHATSILERHWPHVPRWGDVSTLTGEHILRHAPVIDVVAWGSPCQDLSVAGKRAGLGGTRSGLFHEGIRIIKELRELTNGKYPRISIWENVAGALSSGGGADFGQVLNEMDEAGACFSEWRILDAQYFGVPQRRRRVFLVSVFDPATATRCPDPLLPVSEGVRRDTETGAETREEPAGETGTGFTGSSFAQYTEGVGTVRANGGDLGGGSETLVTFTKGKRAQTADDDETWDENRPAPTLNAFDQGDTRATTVIVEEPTFFQMHQSGETRIQQDVMHTLAGYMGTGGNNTPMVAYGLQGNMIGRQDHNGPQGAGISQPGDPMFSLTSTDRHAVATTMAVRRLTPLECERLMGWPDDWTAGQSDTHRYKQCGNGVASPVATWIGEQLMALDQ